MRRVLVTGGAGFLGSHLVDGLIRAGFEVVVFDNESTGTRAQVHPDATFLHGDVRDESALARAFDLGIDVVCHIAGQASIRVSYSDPGEDLGVNVTGTVNVLRQCVERGVARLLFASSMTVYGNPARVPTPESEPADPVAYYGITKWAAERYVHLTARRSDLTQPLHVTSFRMFNVYGPRQSLTNAYQGVLAIFLGQCLRGENIAIHSDGTQSRDFVYVADVVRAWLAAIDEARSHDRVLNLGSGTPTSINELCAGVLARFDHTPESYGVTHEPQQQGDVRESAADIAAAREVLGWSPEVALAEGLAETVRWARKSLDASGRASAPRIPELSTAPAPRRK